MKYIDWYYEKAKTEKKIYAEKKDGYRYWEDLVTATQYCISEEDYGRIYGAGKKQLEKLLKDKNVTEMEQIFYGDKGTTDISLFPDLPCFLGNTGKCARIRDYVCFRTACLYALKYNSMMNHDDMEKEKIRMLGFTWGIVDNAEESMQMEQIEHMVSMQKDKEQSLSMCRADFVKGGMIKIKQYYLETNKIPEIRGASLLLDKVNDEKIKELISREHIRECLVYAGGGKIMGIFPEGKGEEVCQKIGLLIEETTITAQFNFCSHAYEIERLAKDYQHVVEEMDLLLEEHQGLRWDFRIEPQWNQKTTEEALKKEGWRILRASEKEACTSCRNRHAVAVSWNDEQGDRLCPSCLFKRREGGRNAKHSAYQKYHDYVMRKYGKEISDKGRHYNKLEDIAESGFIGIIYGDANNMSSHINNLDSPMMMRYFSETTSDAVTEIVFDALFKNLGREPAFEVIAVGGDDIFLIVPGARAYGIACAIGKNFDEKFQNKSTDSYNMTMSVGVCITHAKMPVQYSFSIAQELLKSAKQKAWQERNKGNGTGTIDWMVIENEMAGSPDLAYQRMGKDDSPEKTLRPYTWKQADAMKKFIRKMQNEKTFAFQLVQSWYQHTKKEAELFYEYQKSRKKETKADSALAYLAKEFEGEAVKNNIVYHGEAFTPWLDAVELWDYMEDMI